MYSRFHESLAENVSLCMCISRVYVHVDCAVSRKTNKLRTEQVLGLGRGTMVYQHFRSLSLHYVSTLRYLKFFILKKPNISQPSKRRAVAPKWRTWAERIFSWGIRPELWALDELEPYSKHMCSWILWQGFKRLHTVYNEIRPRFFKRHCRINYINYTGPLRYWTCEIFNVYVQCIFTSIGRKQIVYK